MPWFKVDDNLSFHHKVVAAGNPAMGLWVRAGSLSAQQLTDGFVADHMVAALGTKAQAEKLVSVGLWSREKGGYRFHEWTERQPSKADVEAERLAAAERMRAYRERKRKSKRKASEQVSDRRSPEQTENFGVGSDEVRDAFADPDPTRPDPTLVPTELVEGAKAADTTKPKATSRAARRPDDWQPTPRHREIAAERGIDVAREHEQFCDHHDAKGSKFIDWNKAFNTWLRNARPSQSMRPAAESEPIPSHYLLPSEVEYAPSGMTDEEADAWQAAQEARRRQTR